ncbi:acyltransferase domain-containing protein [Streptomyces sp. NPDC056773]|uniref:acyltransferase domain-containing protein n=1 Tax=unclassified Streptomyces TaxID=2593676 RepID=UPI0036828092
MTTHDTGWLQTLHTQPSTAPGIPDPTVPTAGEAADRMTLLAVPAADRDAVIATLPDPARTPDLWEALLHCHRTLFAGRTPEPLLTWPNAPAELGAPGRYFYVHLYLLALPLALEHQRRLGIPAEVVRATFADLGAKLTTYRLAHGTGGFDRQVWMARHFRGTLHRLGRLQFEQTTHTGDDLAPHGGPAGGAPVLGVHIPGDGPLTPSLCDASFRAARPFFSRFFPGRPHADATCHSWLLDDQLSEYLSSEANIVTFQRRFRRFGDSPVCDDDILEFVFHAPPGRADLDTLPQTGTLQRAIVAHLRTGRHWRLGHGWTRLP